MSLSRQEIVSAAMAIMDAYGLADLSMRRLGASLGVQPSALYWHFENKQSLLAAMADDMLADLPPLSAGPWQPRLHAWAARLHALLRQHRSGAELVSSAIALGDPDESPAAALASGLVAAGLPTHLARVAASGVVTLVLGHAFYEEQRALAAELGVLSEGVPADSAALLDDAVGLLIDGLAAQVSHA